MFECYCVLTVCLPAWWVSGQSTRTADRVRYRRRKGVLQALCSLRWCSRVKASADREKGRLPCPDVVEQYCSPPSVLRLLHQDSPCGTCCKRSIPCCVTIRWSDTCGIFLKRSDLKSSSTS